MKISFTKPGLPETGALVVLATEGGDFSESANAVDQLIDGNLTRAAKVAKFKGKLGEMVSVLAPAGSKLERILLVGIGKADKLSILGAETLGGKIYMALSPKQPRTVSVAFDALDGAPNRVWEYAAHIANGALLRSYRFDKYRTKEEDDKKPSIRALKIMTPSGGRARKAFEELEKIAEGVFLTRDLVSEPANVLYPESFADICREMTELGVEVDVLGEAEMQKLNMGALLGVGQGSERESKMVIMRWNGAQGKGRKAKSTQIAFVGKGVTFDTGGISIKPAGGMEEMKWDMGGAGAVTGAMKAIAGRKADVNAVGVIGLVENMPDGKAQRPGDVVTSMSGQTIEIINTDAEGRLVLADALTYTQQEFEPKVMINLATLTGAMLVSLGHERAGVFTNDDNLADQLYQAGEETGEKTWQFPMDDAYDKLIASQIADMKNTGGRYGGSITAAKFLQRFVKDNYHPYHAALTRLIEETQKKFGACLLIDCHSMPSIGGPMDSDKNSSRTDFILGDRFGTSCDGWITDTVEQILVKEGFVVKRNRPYAGGFTTQHYSNPAMKTHVLQIEINRFLYMNEESITRLPALSKIKSKISRLIESLSKINADSL